MPLIVSQVRSPPYKQSLLMNKTKPTNPAHMRVISSLHLFPVAAHYLPSSDNDLGISTPSFAIILTDSNLHFKPWSLRFQSPRVRLSSRSSLTLLTLLLQSVIQHHKLSPSIWLAEVRLPQPHWVSVSLTNLLASELFLL